MLPTVAIIGAGFSGISIAYEIVRQATDPIEILQFDDSIYAGKGVAFSTLCPYHLLNVTASRMSAVHNDPDHLLNWLKQEPQSWRQLDPSFADIEIHGDLFLPRMIYGSYLQEIGKHTREIAVNKSILLRTIKEKVIDIVSKNGSLLTLLSSTKTTYRAQAAVIATGVPWSRPLLNSESLVNGKYLNTPWPTFLEPNKIQAWLGNTSPATAIAIIGSGLTMLDAVASLVNSGYQGKINIITKHGLLPVAQDLTLPHHPPFKNTEEFPKLALQIFRKLKQLAKGDKSSPGVDLRRLIESMRPITNPLWLELPQKERRKILRHLFTYWNRYRHRSPKETLEIVSRCINQKRLEVIKAKVVSIEEEKNNKKLTINMIDTQSGRQIPRTFDRVINCTGPSYNIKEQPNPLLISLLERRLAEPDGMGLGLNVDEHYRLLTSKTNKTKSPIFAIGSLLFGTLFETVAVPELRAQSHAIASDIVKIVNQS